MNYFKLITFPDWDTELFLFINRLHTKWLDPIMAVLSSYYSWVAVLILIILIIFYYQKKNGKVITLFLLGGILLNSLINNVLKIIIARPRPSNNESLQTIIHLLENAGTSYSFFSAHSSNSFCLALFTALVLRKRWYSIIIFLWAILVAYSRIYVGKHYPVDVITGILFGCLIGYFAFYLYRKRIRKQYT